MLWGIVSCGTIGLSAALLRSKSLLMLVVIVFIESEARFGGPKKLIVNFSTHWSPKREALRRNRSCRFVDWAGTFIVLNACAFVCARVFININCYGRLEHLHVACKLFFFFFIWSKRSCPLSHVNAIQIVTSFAWAMIHFEASGRDSFYESVGWSWASVPYDVVFLLLVPWCTIGSITWMLNDSNTVNVQ